MGKPGARAAGLKLRLLDIADRPAEALVLPLAHGATVPLGCEAAAGQAGFRGALAETCAVWHRDGCVLLVGLGGSPDARAAATAGAAAIAALPRARHVVLGLHGLAPQMAAALAGGVVQRAWHFALPRPEDDDAPPAVRALDLVSDDPAALAPFWARESAVLSGIALARRLVTEPANRLTPAKFCRHLRALRATGLELEVLRGKQLRHAGLGGLRAVGQAAANRPCLAVLRWPGTLDLSPVAFIGKGVTFDTGGICIKPAEGMWEMRADMAGAAACVGAMLTLALRHSPAPALAVLPLAENAIGADAYRPADILHLHGGTSVEIVDTDAEGRLLLADALSWTRATQHPRAMIDLATLTGAIVVALGHENAGLFDNDPALAAHVAAAGAEAGEPVWRMPIGESHRHDLDSDIADLRQCVPGRGQPDACHAAAFLREFAGDTPWVHLDIAGVEARAEAAPAHARGATGFGVRLLNALVARRFEDADNP